MPFVNVSHEGELELYYEDVGDGAPVVLVGGFTSTAEVWHLQAAGLAAAYRVLCPDNRGSGRTKLRKDDGQRTMARFAGDVCALLDALEIEKIHLVGASMGGMIVQQFAADHPERLQSLVVACSHGGGAMAVSPDPELMVEFAAGSGGNATPVQRQRTLEIVMHPDSFTERPDVVAAYEAGKRAYPHAPEELAARAEAIAAFDVSERLADVRVPTLVMCGDGDQIVPPENSERIAAAIPGAELVVIPRTGHLFMSEEAEACNAAMVGFFRRHTG